MAPTKAQTCCSAIGHVEFAKYRNLVEHRPEVMRRWNSDNQPHPETWLIDLSDK